jgi:hypothetical protein
MRAIIAVIGGACVWFCAAVPVGAADWPAIVIPGKPGVPVIINGVDASYMIVEGDYGLDRPGAVPITIIPPWPYALPPGGYYGPAATPYPRGYYPANGREPRSGRHEIIPPENRRKPKPAESYHRSWSAGSDPVPASMDPPANVNMNIEPQVDFWGRPRPRRR